MLEVPGATGDYQTDLMAKGRAAVQALRDEGIACLFLSMPFIMAEFG